MEHRWGDGEGREVKENYQLYQQPQMMDNIVLSRDPSTRNLDG